MSASRTKVCSKCLETKPVGDFYKHKRSGYRSECKSCGNAASRDWNRKNTHRRRERLERDPLSRERSRESWRRHYRNHREKYLEQARERNAANPEKGQARAAVRQAVANGSLCRQPCSQCGDENAEAHHHSYERAHWLDVEWLCPLHHARHHAALAKEQTK